MFVASVRNGNDVTVKMFCLSKVTKETLPDEVTMPTYDHIIQRLFFKVSFVQVEQRKDKYYLKSFRVYKTKPVTNLRGNDYDIFSYFFTAWSLPRNRNRI